MTIRREDLVAAAAVGLLQYRQIDPLLVYLLQRDVLAKRLELADQGEPVRYGWWRSLLRYLVALLALMTLGMFGLLFATRGAPQAAIAVQLFLIGFYLLVVFRLVLWSRRRGYGKSMRIALATFMTCAPVAMMALHQVGT